MYIFPKIASFLLNPFPFLSNMEPTNPLPCKPASLTTDDWVSDQSAGKCTSPQGVPHTGACFKATVPSWDAQQNDWNSYDLTALEMVLLQTKPSLFSLYIESTCVWGGR